MGPLRRCILSLALVAGLVPAASFAQVPPPVPALPDTERRTTYSISGTTCACNVNFALFGDSTDFQNWLEVYLNGVLVSFNDLTFGWTITVPTGSLSTRARPISDAILTFNSVQTGTVQIVGARRPRRAVQLTEGGVTARALNQVFTDIIAQNRETWDRTNDITGRSLKGLPGESVSPFPSAALRAGGFMCWDGTGLIPLACAPLSGTGNVSGPNSATDGHFAVFNGATGAILKDGGAPPVLAPSATIDTTNAANITSGNLSINRLNSGTGASSGTFWRGDGAWANPAATGLANVVITPFTASGTYTPNANLVVADVECVGSGGGGGGTPATSSGQVAAGGGGAAGGYTRGLFSAATLGSPQTVTVGAAGTSSGGVAGGAGGAVTFGALLTANGGAGGPLGVAQATSTITGGASGGSASGGYLNVSGQTGYDGWGISATAVIAQGGPGGQSVFGAAGTPAMTTSSSINGVGATGFGSGGGGAAAGASAGQNAGGAGSKGLCIVHEFLHG